MNGTDFDEFVRANIPYFIAKNYHQLVQEQQPQKQVDLIVHIYNLILRVLTINLVNQYLSQPGEVNDTDLNEILYLDFLHQLTTKVWKETFFAVLRAYENKKERFFIPELYELYWSPPTPAENRRIEVEMTFESLAQVAAEVQGKISLPQDESGWKAKAEEHLGNLRFMLESLSFLGEYDLIHVLNQDSQFYYYEIYRGLHVARDQQQLPEDIRLLSGSFYLRAKTGTFLLLHPLVVFWKDNIEPADIGVFDRRVSEQLRYMLAMSGQIRESREYLEEFAMFIYRAIEEKWFNPARIKKLSWWRLRTTCETITRQRMAKVSEKYRKEVYVRRDEVYQKFAAFLADPGKRGFILFTVVKKTLCSRQKRGSGISFLE